jgi:polar amino acid transport system permease protein
MVAVEDARWRNPPRSATWGPMMNDRSTAVRVLSFALALALAAGIIVGALLAVPHYRWNWGPVWEYRRLYVDGWLATLGISAIALPVSCVLGVLFAFARRAPFLPLRHFAQIYVELTRGAPLLVQIYLYFYVFANALHLQNRYVVGPLILAAFSGAYISEIIRAGIEGVGKSQIETARAIGLTARQTYRYVIFPQAIRQILPSLAGQFVSLVKDSSLLSIIAIAELANAASNTNSNTLTPFESYLPLAIGYLVITLPISLWTQSLERRAKFDT